MGGELSARQRAASYLTIAIVALALIGGVLLRSSVENATSFFSDKVTGISARYPAGWFLEQGSAGQDFVFRAQDPASLPFKTTLAVSILPVGGSATVYDVAELLTVRRAGSLPSFHTLAITPITLPNGLAATRIDYAYAATDPNPYLQSLPIVVSATDVVVLSRQQAIIASFQSDATTVEKNRHYFNAFLARLQF